MASMLPVAVYGLKVPAGDIMIPASVDFPATFRITMAAIDPSAKIKHTGIANGNAPPRATLKMVYDPSGPSDEDLEDSDSEGSDEYLKSLIDGRESDGLSDEDDEDKSSAEEEKNGGPSDPSKLKKARKEAAAQKFLDALAEQSNDKDEDGELELDQKPKVNGITKPSVAQKGKGKEKAAISDKEDEEDVEGTANGMEEVVICTLDPEKTFQQPIDITIPEDQPAFFKVSGTHTIYLSGNYVIPPDDGRDSSEEDSSEDDYDLTPDEDEIELENKDESDELDDLEDPRITDLGSEDEQEALQLVKKELKKDEEKAEKKGQQPGKSKNKRQAEESDEDVEVEAELKTLADRYLRPGQPNEEVKPNKKQLKKLKNNAGKGIEAVTEKSEVKKEDPAIKGDKKVQFAKDLEQGPASSPSTIKAETNNVTKNESKKENDKPKASLGVKMVQGVKVDDKKLGKGPPAKKGDNLGMRYIGKLSDGKEFDSNKKGTPYRFKLGTGQVVKGWEIGVTGMSVGGERRIIIPANLGYGSKSLPGIPANSELTFDMKLLEIR